jgi:hypothetical protein
MRKLLVAGTAVAAGLLIANSAFATVVLSSTFETPDVPTGGYGIFAAADGWTTLTGPGIEIQDHAAGDPAATGGNQFVELDSNSNSSMYYTIGSTGTYDLSFLFSPRPGVGAASNIISVYLDATLLNPPGSLTGGPLSGTDWNSYGAHFSAAAGQKLIFAAEGTSESLGGYVDNITLTAVPEPATWAMMIAGFGMAGMAIRRRRTALA